MSMSYKKTAFSAGCLQLQNVQQSFLPPPSPASRSPLLTLPLLLLLPLPLHSLFPSTPLSFPSSLLTSPHLPSPSPHRPLHGPLFLLDLVLDEEGAHYSSDLSDFKTTLLSVFDRGILVTHTVPQIEKVQQETSHQTLITALSLEACVFISACSTEPGSVYSSQHAAEELRHLAKVFQTDACLTTL